jgi:ribosomal protein S27AE
LREAGAGWSATLAHRVSCPGCGRTIVLADAAKAGDRVECCGRQYVLTFEYGAFALEDT